MDIINHLRNEVGEQIAACRDAVLSRVELATQVSALAFAIACPPTAP